MRKRPLGRFGFLAAALTASALFGAGRASASDDAQAPPATETVGILDAAKSGDLAVTVRGAGESRVKFTIENKSAKRLNVVIPPGLVAASTAGQAFQSMGLGTPTNNLNSFGAFRTGRNDSPGFRSIPAAAPAPEGLAVSPGQTVEMAIPSVCLNFGLPTPTAKNVFRLMDVETYSPDARVRKSLKSLSALGTSQLVAQAAMWHVCNGMTFDQIARQNVVPMNAAELAQAARFVEAVDSSSGDIVDPTYFQQGRIALRIVGEGPMAKDAKRLVGEIDGVRVMGLPVRVVEDVEALEARAGTVLLNAVLVSSKPGQTSARVSVRSATANGQWQNLGTIDLKSGSAVSDLKGEGLADDLGRALARSFVAVSPARRSTGSTTFKVTNKLPMTLSSVTLKAGKAGDIVRMDGMGIGPARSGMASIPAATATVDSVEFNGL